MGATAGQCGQAADWWVGWICCYVGWICCYDTKLLAAHAVVVRAEGRATLG